MNFQDLLKQEMQQMERNSNNFGDKEVDYPSKKLKHEALYFGKDNSSFTVRILPPATPEQFFAYPVKEIWLNKTNRNGKELKSNFVLPFNGDPETSILTRALNEWIQQQRVPNNFSKTQTARKFYYVNAIQVGLDNAGTPYMERDQNNNIVVRLLKLPQSAYQSLLGKLSDPMFTPQNAGEYGVIGETNAYPIRFSKPSPGGMAYSVDVFQKDLGALPQGWQNELEDLAYQGTPSEEYNQEFVEYFINVVNGTEPQKESNNSGQQQQSFQQPQQGFQQQGGFQQPQQPVQPQQGFGQSQGQPMGMPPGQQGFQQAKTYEPPTQPVHNNFQQPPVQEQNNFQAPPQQSFNQAPPVDTGDASPYFNAPIEDNLPGAFNDLPDVNQQPQPEPVQQPQQSVQPTPPMGGGAQNVNDVLAQMQQQLGQ